MTALTTKTNAAGDPVRSHVEMIHQLARGIDGVLVVSVFNADLSSDRGTITHHRPGDVDGMVDAIEAHRSSPGANVYVGLQVMRASLARGQRGAEADIVAVLGLVADMDGDTGRNTGSYPVPPNYVLETSPGNLQPFWLFDRPVKPAEAKAIARGLKIATGSDHGTADIAHVWRIPGTLNWPNKAKLNRGRSAEPADVTVSAQWDGSLTDPFALLSAVGNHAAPSAQPVELGDLPSIDGVAVSDKLAALLAANDIGDRSAHAAKVVEQIAFDGHSAEEGAALFLAATGNWLARYSSEGHARTDFARLWGKYGKPDYSTLATGLLRNINPPPAAANDNDPQSKPRERFNLTWFADIEEGKPKLWTIKGVIGKGEMTTIAGLPGTGKSVITGDAGFHVAAGLDWFGRKVVPGMVVYVAAERRALTERRMIALRRRYGIDDVPLVIISGRLDMTSSLADAKALADVVKQAADECDQPCAWIILDTLTRVFGPGDQNTSKDMTRFVHACDELIQQTGAHLTVVHHTAWSGDRGKGAIDLDGAVDASFLVHKNAGTYTLKCDGANDGEEGTIATFTLESVEITKDEDGEPTTAPIVVPGESVATKLAAKGHAKQVLEALRAAIAEDGVVPDGPGFPDGCKVVKEKQWRSVYYESDTSVAVGTMKKRFERSKKDLLAKAKVRQVGQWCWPA